MAVIDIQLIEGLGLPYAPGAETGLSDESLVPLFNDAWQVFLAAFPGKTLVPLFDGITVGELADMVDGIRINGEEPPNPFDWFTLACDDAETDAVLALVSALPMVVFAQRRSDPVVAVSVSYGTNPDTNLTLQIQPAPNGIDAIYAWGVAVGAYATDLMRIPLMVSTKSYAIAGLTVGLSATLSALVVRRRVDHLDLVSVLKTRD